MCSNIEDCFRYVCADKSIIAEVIGFGDIQKYDDEYYGYFDMYVCEYLRSYSGYFKGRDNRYDVTHLS